MDLKMADGRRRRTDALQLRWHHLLYLFLFAVFCNSFSKLTWNEAMGKTFWYLSRWSFSIYCCTWALWVCYNATFSYQY